MPVFNDQEVFDLRKLVLGAALALSTAGFVMAFAGTAYAYPTLTSRCTNCHSGANLPVTTAQTANNGTTATYSASATGAGYIAVFNGSTKLSQITGASGTFSVPVGGTYTLYAVKGPGTGDGIGSTTVSPVAPAPTDTVAPTTTTNALSTYVSSAAITLSATDNAGGSGVAATYYRLDGAAQVAGTSVSTSIIGSHSLEYWSVDVAGNAEAHRTVTFTVTAPVPVDATAPVTTSNAVATYVSSAAITLSATDAGGSGVAATYYRLDGAAQVAGTAVSTSVIGSHSLEFWSVDVAGNAEVHKTVNFTVEAPAPTPDVTAPVTTSNALASYVSAASITLTATDNAGGSGVAGTYYILDGGSQTAGALVSVDTTGTHSLEFWSVDVAGNVESHKNVSFAVTDPVPTAQPTPCTLSIKVSKRTSHVRRYVTLSGTVAPGQGAERLVVYVKKPGSRRWVAVRVVTTVARTDATGNPIATWSLRYKPTKRGIYSFKVRFAGTVSIAAANSTSVKLRVR